MSTYPKQLESKESLESLRWNGSWGESERWELRDGEVLTGVHLKADCAPPCPLHYPSEHSMDDAPLHWRGDRGIFERLCPHGVGHPDPDTLEYIRMERGKDVADAESIHGCDGCCAA